MTTVLFRLLDLPTVALRLTLLIMGPSDVIFLCLFFRRLRRVAQSIKWTGHMPNLDYCSGENKEAQLSLMYVLNNEYGKTPLIRWNFRNNGCRMKKRKVNGQKFRCCLNISPTTVPLIIISSQDNTFFVTTIMTLFSQLFRPSLGLYLEITPETMSRFSRIPSTISLLVFKESKCDLRIEDLESFLTRHDGQKLLTYVYPLFSGELGQNSNILRNIENLCITDGRSFRTSHLFEFTGKNLLVRHSFSVHGWDVNEFLTNWVAGPDTNLDSFAFLDQIYLDQHVLKGLNAQRWDPAKRAPIYKSNAVFKLWDTDLYDCSNARDIVRESDGMMASVKFDVIGVFFFVWRDRGL